MVNIDQVKKWMRAKGISQNALAEMAMCSPITIRNLLKGKRKTNPSILFRINELMEQSSPAMKVYIPPEIEPLIRKWADEAHCSIDKMVNQILADVLRLKDAYEDDDPDEYDGEDGEPY